MSGDDKVTQNTKSTRLSAKGINKIGRYTLMLFALTTAAMVIGSVAVSAQSTSWFNFNNFKNYFYSPLNGHHFRPPTCDADGYGYACSTTTTILACSGTPVVSFSPNPTVFTQNDVNITVSGLTDCAGTTINVDNYKGCSTKDILTSFVSGSTGGNVIITNQSLSGGYGQRPRGNYGYWICVNNSSGQATEGILKVTSTTTIPQTTTTIHHYTSTTTIRYPHFP